jgi:hypothetical protein
LVSSDVLINIFIVLLTNTTFCFVDTFWFCSLHGVGNGSNRCSVGRR